MATELRDVDLANPDSFVAAVPHEAFERLRREAPVYWHEDPNGPGFWVLTRYDDVVAVNRDAATFSSHRRTALFNEMPEEDLAQQQLMMLNMDPPKHTKLRLLVNKGFTPRMVGTLEESTRRHATEIIDRVGPKGECDFVTEVAAELPLLVIAELMGVPIEDRSRVFEWSNKLIGQDDPEYNS